MRFDKTLSATSEQLKGKNFYEKSRQLLKRFKKLTENEYYYLQGRLCESKGDVFVDKKGNKLTIAGSNNNYYLWSIRNG